MWDHSFLGVGQIAKPQGPSSKGTIGKALMSGRTFAVCVDVCFRKSKWRLLEPLQHYARVQSLDIRALRLPFKHKLAHNLTSTRPILNSPTRVPGGHDFAFDPGEAD